jgi:hypothetical protein
MVTTLRWFVATVSVVAIIGFAYAEDLESEKPC